MTPRLCPLAAGALAAGLTLTSTGVAHAGINPGYDGTPRWAVPQTANWETLSNLTMRTLYRQPGFGWRAGFCVVAGVRWDSGTFYGRPWGNVEGRAFVAADGPAGPCTVFSGTAQVTMHVSPLFVAPDGGLTWYANQGCTAAVGGASFALAWAGRAACSAPTDAGPGSNYRQGGYSISTIVAGQAFADQPSSGFYLAWNNWSAERS